MERALISVPTKAGRGAIIDTKALISHHMETGFRHSTTGELIPRNIITSFVCRCNGEEIFRTDLFSSHRRKPVYLYLFLCTRDGERHDRVRMGRRQRLLGDRTSGDQRRMRAPHQLLARAIVVVTLGVWLHRLRRVKLRPARA